jgi:hypothetical protein
VTEVQVVDTSSCTEKSTVLLPSLHDSENVPEDEEWTPISLGETSSSHSLSPTPSITPRSKNLASEIAYVTTIHVLSQPFA